MTGHFFLSFPRLYDYILRYYLCPIISLIEKAKCWSTKTEGKQRTHKALLTLPIFREWQISSNKRYFVSTDFYSASTVYIEQSERQISRHLKKIFVMLEPDKVWEESCLLGLTMFKATERKYIYHLIRGNQIIFKINFTI